MFTLNSTWSNGGRLPGYRLFLWLLAILAGWMLSPSAFAQDITVASPVAGTTDQSPLWVRAHNVGCGGLYPIFFAYSIDNNTDIITGVTPYDIDVTNQQIGGGTHTVHFKSWTLAGLCPVVDSTFTVGGAPPPPPTGPGGWIPPNATVSANLETSNRWEWEHDGGTPGNSSGSTVYPANTPSGDTGREFYMTYSNRGGELFHLSFDNDSNATHFVYDTYIYVQDPQNLDNLEMDMNQVMSNGKTVIFGTQCSGYSRSWEYTTTDGHSAHWHPSNIPCNPQNWAANTWHHIQIASHRDDNGVVTYDWVTLDGTLSNFQNATGNSAMYLGWPQGDLLINFQLDGNGGEGSVTTFLHTTNVYRW